MNYEYPEDEIKKRTLIALGCLQKNDALLMEEGVNERSIAHKLAEYLQEQFPDWNVDCEYNRRGEKLPKDLKGISECNEHRKTDRVYPDIIVHKRKSPRENLLVIELKKNGLNSQCDIKKLKLLTDAKGDYGYSLGLFIQFDNSRPNMKWFKNGKHIG